MIAIPESFLMAQPVQVRLAPVVVERLVDRAANT
jgi:hypothetical protein